MQQLNKTDPKIYQAIVSEMERQNNNIELIASENFVPEEVLIAQGSALTNKYAEGYPNARWYGGCDYVDVAEGLAIERLKKLFGAEHANVQPHSGSQANMAVYMAMLDIGDKVLAMDLACGGHLTHGHKMNFSGKYFDIIPYGVHKETEKIDYDEIDRLAKEYKPKMILAGASAYSQIIDFVKFREIADSIGAILMVDMAHFAGLVAGDVHPNPVPYAEFVTSTTHKTLRGPRGGIILCREEFSKAIDRTVFPGIQGGPLEHVIAAKAVCFKLALEESFKVYAKQIVANAKELSNELKKYNFRIVSGGTENHLMLVDLTTKGLSGKEAALLLDESGITVNKNMIPYDTKSAFETSGIRLGTPAITSRGMKEKEVKLIAKLINDVIESRGEKSVIKTVKNEVENLTAAFPLYNNLMASIQSTK